MPSFDLADGYVTFRGNFDKFEKDIMEGRKKVDALNQAIGTRKFEMSARESKRINDEMAKAARNAKRIMDEIQLGKLGVFMRDFNSGLTKFASMAGKFGAGATGIGAAALASGAAGSPLAQSTLEGSFKLLATEIGGTFTPLVKDVSRGLQDATKAWRGMSTGMKDFLNDGAKFIGVAGLMSLSLAAVAKGFSLLMAHPFIALLSAGGAALNWANSQNQKQQEAVGKGQADIYGVTAKSAQNSEMGMRLSLLKPEEAAKEAKANMDSTWKKYEEDRKAHASIYNSPTLGGMSAIVEGVGLQSREKSAREAAIASGTKLEEAKFLYNQYAGGKLKDRPAGKGGEAGMLLGSMGPASMTDIQGLFKSFQMAGAGGNQLEAEQRKTELENAQKMLENSNAQVQLLGEIKNNLPMRK